MKKTIKVLGVIAIIAVLSFSMIACDNGGGGGRPNPTPGGDPALSGTISITPAGPVNVGTQLTAVYSGDEIVGYQWKRGGSNISGATATTYTPTEAGSYTVTVRATGYTSKTSAAVTVNEVQPDAITYTVTQIGGVDNISDSTGIMFTFNASVDSLNLTAADINVDGTASKGMATLTGSGTSRTLSPISVTAAGLATVSIAKEGIETTAKNVIVHKAGQTDPEYWTITWNFNGGTAGTNAQHPTLIAKGTVLAKPLPDPTKADNNFGGWYTSSGLTQMYNFANTVTTNLTLYAKWEAGSQPIGNTLAEKLTWVKNPANVQNGGTYTIEVSADEAISPQILSYDLRNNITIKLEGSGGEKVVSLSSNGVLFTVGRGVKLVLDNNITLRGRNNNNNVLVRVNGDGALEMKTGAKITDNTGSGTNGGGGGVYVAGTFTMDGGEISNNTANRSGSYGGTGGGVYVDRGTFTMNGGVIGGMGSGNEAEDGLGGGVYVYRGTFTMNDGLIRDNQGEAGGGVYVTGSDAIFTMSDGQIFNNQAFLGGGGGVYVEGNSATFTMIGGEISSNSAMASSGGGVYISLNSYFRMVTGTIYGNNPLNLDSNIAGGVGYGYALFIDVSNTRAQRGTFSGATWNSMGTLSTSDNTIRVVNGVLQ